MLWALEMAVEYFANGMIKAAYWRTRLWVLTRMADLFRYSIFGNAENPTLDDIRVLYSNEDYIFVHKRYDVLINSNKPEDKVTVETQMKKLFPELVNPSLGHSFHFVHRLDYPTSGVLCIARTKDAAGRASKQFSSRKVKKYYLALVRGHVATELIDVDLTIGEDTRWQNVTYRMCVGLSKHCSKPLAAKTRLLVLQRGLYDDYPATKVLLKPITGRRHQLRLHCAELGHTIVGDFSYSNQKDVKPFRMFLHAHRLILPTTLGTLDVNGGDPFTECNQKNKWNPLETLNQLDAQAYEKIDTEIANLVIS